MRFVGKILLACIAHLQIWDSAAFLTRTPNPITFTAQIHQSKIPNLLRVNSVAVRRTTDGDNKSDRKLQWKNPTESDLVVRSAENAGALRISAKLMDANMPQSVKSTLKSAEEIWGSSSPVKIQGGSLRTCNLEQSVNRVHIALKTGGRPLNACVDLWQGPDNTPQNVRLYVEDANLRPFRTIIETPRNSNAVCIRNTAELEFPLAANLDFETETDSDNVFSDAKRKMEATCKPRIVQGGAVYTTPFTTSVSSIQVLLQTDGRPLNARIELLHGPNNSKQVMEVYQEDGYERPFYTIIETPGDGNVIRIVNTSTVEFPLTAIVEPFSVENDDSEPEDEDNPHGLMWI